MCVCVCVCVSLPVGVTMNRWRADLYDQGEKEPIERDGGIQNTFLPVEQHQGVVDRISTGRL